MSALSKNKPSSLSVTAINKDEINKDRSVDGINTYLNKNLNISTNDVVNTANATTSTASAKNANKSTINKNAPIGLFDSGIGGLSVYLHLADRLPNERYIYYADTLNMPYGARSKEEITQLTIKAVTWLVNMGCKMIVIACNSASAHALYQLRAMYPDIPIVGLVPALKPAILNSKAKQVAVLATQATLDGRLLNDVIDTFAMPNGVQVTKWFDPELVPWVETGMSADSETAHRLLNKLHEFAQQQIDYLVLGCTHYPFFRDFITHEIAQHNLNINVIDSGAAIASRVHDILLQNGALMSSDLLDLSNASSQSHLASPSNNIYIGHINFSHNFNERIDNPISSNLSSKSIKIVPTGITNVKNTLKDNTFIHVLNKESDKISHPTDMTLAGLKDNHSVSDLYTSSKKLSKTLSKTLSKAQSTQDKWMIGLSKITNTNLENTKLAFFITDAKMDLQAISVKVSRLLHS